MKRIGAAIIAIIVAAPGFAFYMLVEMRAELAAMETALVALADGDRSGALGGKGRPKRSLASGLVPIHAFLQEVNNPDEAPGKGRFCLPEGDPTPSLYAHDRVVPFTPRSM